ncbi:MAG: threonine synthase [Candidatus Diapherotrites archaeon]
MPEFRYYSTNNPSEQANFETALLKGIAPDFGLYTLSPQDIPKISKQQLREMRSQSFAEISFEVLSPFTQNEIPEDELRALLEDAYNERIIPTTLQTVSEKESILWLTKGPTYSFKDYAARFLARTLNYFLGVRELKRTVIVATSGDTGGAVADAVHGLDNIDNVVFFPKGSISEGQRRQMTTLKGNVFAFEVNGDFDVCQALAKSLIGDKMFAESVFGDAQHLTSANSISLGRLLPQAVYPFFAFSRLASEKPFVASVPSGNFGGIMGTVFAKAMGLPVQKILCGVNENREFPDFLSTGKYEVRPSISCPSSAMIVSHPGNLARLVDFYGGHLFDERDPETRKVKREGVISRMPDLERMRKDLYSVSISNPEHFQTMKEVFEQRGIILDPHGAVGWKTLQYFARDHSFDQAIVYETADPGKFPEDVQKAIGITPPLPPKMQAQAESDERIYSIESAPLQTTQGLKLSDAQVEEAQRKIRQLFA